MTFLTSSKIKKKMVRKKKRISKRKSTKRKLRKMKPSVKKKMKETTKTMQLRFTSNQSSNPKITHSPSCARLKSFRVSSMRKCLRSYAPSSNQATRSCATEKPLLESKVSHLWFRAQNIVQYSSRLRSCTSLILSIMNILTRRSLKLTSKESSIAK